MESYSAPVLDFNSQTLVPDMKQEIRKNGIALVRLHHTHDTTLLDYQRDIDSVMHLVRPDGGTAHGSKGMGGITKRYGAACSTKVWRIRLNSRVKECYSGLYGNQKLSIGCDAYTALADDAKRSPPKTAKTAKDRYFNLTGGSLQPHIDVHPTKMTSPGNKTLEKLKTINSDFPISIQGQLILRSIPKGGATFVMAPGEHLNINPNHFNSEAKGDFATCTPTGYDYFEGKWRAVDNLDAGILILWDSRLPHGNKLADDGVDRQRRGLFICWQPIALVDETRLHCKLNVKKSVHVNFKVVDERSSLKKRKWDAITNGGTTDHWAGYVPGGNKGHRGGHYSNGNKLSKVVHDEDNRVVFPPDLAAKIYDAL